MSKTKSVFPTNQALFKRMFLAVRYIEAKGAVRVNSWKYIYSSLVLHFPKRIEESL
ncbi:MAG: putative transposase [Chlamydiales bacterium]|jgi:putative transposase